MQVCMALLADAEANHWSNVVGSVTLHKYNQPPFCMNKLHAMETPAWHVAYICYSVATDPKRFPPLQQFNSSYTTSVCVSLYGVYGYSYPFQLMNLAMPFLSPPTC